MVLEVKVYQCFDDESQWIAEVQPLDIVTRGRDPIDALEEATAAARWCLEDDQKNGRNFWDRAQGEKALKGTLWATRS